MVMLPIMPVLLVKPTNFAGAQMIEKNGSSKYIKVQSASRQQCTTTLANAQDQRSYHESGQRTQNLLSNKSAVRAKRPQNAIPVLYDQRVCGLGERDIVVHCR